VPLNDSAVRYADLVRKEIALSNRRGGGAPNKSLGFVGARVSPPAVNSIFFGGGTPTILPAEQLIGILDEIRSNFTVSPDAEISVECNPKTANAAALAALYKAGFNRLSIGLQSTNDALLANVGRVHTCADFLQTLTETRAAGFTNINVDVMHGLPGQTQEQYLDTLCRVCDLNVPHISAYALILEKGTPLYRKVEIEQILTLPDEDAVADMQDAGIAYLAQRGYARYEISNFAKAGHACRHNLVYWNNEPYLGFGVAAHSSLPGEGRIWLRTANAESISTYEKKLRKNKLPTAETIKLNLSEQMFETVMLGLRKVEGVDRRAFENRFGLPVDDVYAEAAHLDCWTDSATHLQLNAHGLDMLNTVLVSFR